MIQKRGKRKLKMQYTIFFLFWKAKLFVEVC
jgi:hypothetical protein